MAFFGNFRMRRFIDTMDSQALFDILLLSNDATAIYSGEALNIQLANEAMLKIWGKDQSVRGMRFEDAIPEMAGQPFTELLKNVWRTGETFSATDMAATLEIDGKLVTSYFDFKYAAIRNANGEMYCILHTATDVTQRVLAWKIVREKEEEAERLNQDLAASNEEYMAINEELAALNEEYHATNEELQVTNERLESLNEEYHATIEELAALNEEYQTVNEQLQNAMEELEKLSKSVQNANTELTGLNTSLSAENSALNMENFALSMDVKRVLGLFSDTPIAVALLQGERMYIETANKPMLELWGKTEDLLGKPIAEALPELEGQALPGILKDVFQNGKTYHGNEEKIILSRNDILKASYFNFVYKPIIGSNGNTEAIMVVASEVSGQVEARKLVDENNERLSLALFAGKLGSYDLDLKTGVMECSDQCKLNFGIAASERFDFPDLMKTIFPQHRGMVEQNIAESIEAKTLYDVEYQISWPDESLHWIQANGTARYDEHGTAVRMVGVTQDITEKKLYEQRKDDFLSVASHELKTPITVLKANLQLLERLKENIQPAAAAKLIESAVKSMGKISGMVDELLDLGKQADGKLELHISTFNLLDLLNNCARHESAVGKHELLIDASPLQISADEHRIEQVVTNFINNAVKYAPEGKAIRLYTEEEDGQVRISVADEGQGIAQDQLPHLFERYWQANKTGGTTAGLGLGLYICAEIVKKHGGNIGVTSEIGKGSTFWFTLPV